MTERVCPFCPEGFKLVMKLGHLTCLECRCYLMRKGEPDYDEAWATRIMLDEYWRIHPLPTGENLIQIKGTINHECDGTQPSTK